MKLSKAIYKLIFSFLIIHSSVYSQRAKNGNYFVPGANTVVNTYTTLTADAVAGATSISVASNAMTGGVFGATPLAPGDLIMIMQNQGASINIETYTYYNGFGPYTVPVPYTFAGTWPNHVHEWGAVEWVGYFNEALNGYNNAGKFEEAEVLSVSGAGTINLQCGLTNNYLATGHVQIIRIPRFDNLTVPAGTSIIPTVWNGSTGGVVALEVDNDLTVNGTIESNAAGFRGGQVDATGKAGNPLAPNEVRYCGTDDPSEGSEKGEGIHGYVTELNALVSRYGMSAASNGGGGGGYQNCGGGGGSNIYNGAARYTGTGVPDPAYNAFWALDLSYPNFNSDPQTYSSLNGTISPGGGVGGYALSSNNQNEATVGPRNSSWGGDARKSNGGRGGHALDYDPTRMYFGGGGGAGDQDSGEGGSGGRGGGIVYLKVYGNTTGNGIISANGEAGQNTNPALLPPSAGDPRKGNDGAGGGGAGGYIYIENATPLPGTLTISATGGNGGNQVLQYLGPLTDEAGGPGGGGAGGAIAFNGGAPVQIVTAGNNGTTNSTHVSNFPPNGATRGHIGVASLPSQYYDLTVSDVTICAGQSTTLTATVLGTLPSGGAVRWYTQQFGGAVVQTGTTYNVSPGTTTTYYVGVCPGGTFRLPVTVTVISSPNLTITPPSAVCSPSTVDITAPAVTAGSDAGTLTYWTNAGATVPLVSPNAVGNGTYYIQLDIGGGCTTVEPVTVTVNALPNLSITDPANVCSPTTVNLTAPAVTAGSDAGTLTYWTDAGATTSVATPASVGNGTYYIQLQNAAGCTSIQSVTATVSPTPNLTITNPPAACSPATVNITAPAVTAGSDAGTLSYWTNAGATIALGTPGAVASSGTYYIQLQNALGCSSIQPVNVTVTSSPNLTITPPSAVCSPSTVDITAPAVTVGSDAGTLTYWTNAGATVPLVAPNAVGNGTYYIQLDIGGGCTTVEPVTVTVNALPNLSITDPADVCSPATVNLTAPAVTAGSDAGTLTYWTDAGATSPLATPGSVGAGVYYIQLEDAAGCTSVNSVTATVNALPNLVITDPSAVCAPATVNITAPAVTAGSDAGTLSYWTDAGLTLNLPVPSAVASGTYYIELIDANGCSSSGSVVATVNSTPNLFIVDPTAVCAPSTIDLTAPAITAGSDAGTLTYWTDAGATTPLLTPAAVSGGIYYIELTDANTCSSIAAVNAVVHSIPTIVVVDPNPVCIPGTVDITAPAVTSGSDPGTLTYWTDAGATTSLVNPSTVAVAGTYYIQLEDANTCVVIAPVDVVVTNNPNLVVTDPSAVCSPSSVDLTAPAVTAGSDAGTLTYWINAGATMPLATPNAVGSGTYYIQLELSGGCVSIEPVVAVVHSTPNLVITDPASVCVPGTVDITSPAITSGSDAGTLTYWTDAGASIPLATPSAVGNGTYYIQLQDANGCNAIGSVDVTVDPLENASFNLIPACEGATAVINGNTGGVFVLVSPMDGAVVDGSTGTLSLASAGIVYEISYTTSGACSNSSSQTVIPNDCSPEPEIIIPTAFTPDNDLVHDLWIIENLDARYPNNRVSVFNRWGNLVFEHVASEGQPYSSNAWDGTNQFNGEKLPVASYFYVIETGVLEDEDLTGTVSIILK